ncbi:hypothetical protein RvY_13444 [Ramazzottius varieornatus]|uniref:Peptidase M16 N-terminal domain-containing protein n=1 Tax=Ramazzottius varieornatus TaxID=947166 RepID=A0A1D1VMU6_RAMVA|nr:hypothetical protein RvY_13444 [Ramazzottius varieornatus]
MYIAKRGFAKLTDTAKAAAQAAASQSRSGSDRSPSSSSSSSPRSSSHSQHPHFGHEGHVLRVTRLPNDLLVATEDHASPLARICVAVKAGSRYEPAELPGLTHHLRGVASCATKQCSAFGLSRNLEQLGASFRASTTRDLMLYTLEVSRQNLKEAIKFLSYATTQQEFKAWEVHDAQDRLLVDLDILKIHPEVRLVELLHKAAYRDGLKNSLYAPRFTAGNYHGSMLTEFAKATFKTNRMAISGVGVSHDELLNYAQKYFKMDVGEKEHALTPWSAVTNIEPVDHRVHHINGGNIVSEPARYGGGEAYEETIDCLTYAAYVTEGPGLNEPRQLLALKLLQHVIGGSSKIKWGRGVSPLARAAASATNEPFAVNPVSFDHADSSLFGVAVVCNPKDARNVLRATIDILHGKEGVDQQRLEQAKNRLASAILMGHESGAELVQDMATQALINKQILTPEDAANMVGKISLEELIMAAKHALAGRATFAAVGNLAYCPRLDDVA